LEAARKSGVLLTRDLLAILTPTNFDEVWPIIAPLLSQTIELQQSSGRRAMQSYMAAAALAAGFPLAKMRLPDTTKLGDGRLPSGMPWNRLIASQPLAVKHRIDNGMSAVEAVDRAKSQLTTAINSQAFSDFRDTAFDYVVQGPQAPSSVLGTGKPMAQLDAEYEERISTLRQQNENGIDTSAAVMRYYRQPEPGACSFCLMLATKGATYFGADTPYGSLWGKQMGFRGANRFGGARPHEWRAHTNCRCAMFPVFSNTAMSNITGVDDTYFNNKNSIWRDPKTGREYDLRAIAARKSQVKDLIAKRDLVSA